MRILFTVLAFLGLFAGPEPIESVNLVVVGESLRANETLAQLQNIVATAGKTLNVEFAADADNLPEGEWDAVIFSQKDADALKSAVKSAKAAYGKKIPVYLAQTDMAASKKLAGSCGMKILPDACAYANLDVICKDEFVALREGNLTPVGCYTRACVWYEILYNTKIFGSRYGAGLKEEDRRCAQLSADAAVKKPYKVCLK